MKYKRKIITWAIFLIVFVYLVLTIAGLLQDINEKKLQELEIRADIEQKDEEYKKLLEKQKLLQQRDPEYMEELARELGMLKEGEIVFEEREN